MRNLIERFARFLLLKVGAPYDIDIGRKVLFRGTWLRVVELDFHRGRGSFDAVFTFKAVCPDRCLRAIERREIEHEKG